jgi:hypothetical protein
MRVGSSLAASPDLSLQQKRIQDALNTGGILAAERCAVSLTHGHLLDLYHAVRFDDARIPGIGRRLACLLRLLGYLSFVDKTAEKKWEKEGAKLYQIFYTQRRDCYNKMPAAEYLAIVRQDVLQPDATVADAVSRTALVNSLGCSLTCLCQAALVAPTTTSLVTHDTSFHEQISSGNDSIVPVVPASSTLVRRQL